ncbi:alpha/beta hydrolase [Sulfidibacter corallicola]|uniref:Alpha/beta fold hydrolase n=1 Tax=Sulfidibacter corallicola TaxID=2818388 RepID=A0A8A4TWV1_SULCO|nr:alpha/beta fold hydrolase [Sulfidibacter corallicola]QTD53827.1 alpha/beta fold hydrolase [Sulfidibacter corallicola]
MSEIANAPLPGFALHPHIRKECQPFHHLDGNDSIVVFIHGFTGSPADMRQYVQAYREAGYDVAVPLVPGHGSHVSLLEKLTFRELTIPFKPLLQHFRARYRRLHLLGLSYGGVIAATLAVELPVIDSLTLFAPAFYLNVADEKRVAWVKRLSLFRYVGKLKKTKIRNRPDPGSYNHEYTSVPLLPMVDLHRQSAYLRPRLKEIKVPVYYAHGDADVTIPIASNWELMRRVLPRAATHHVTEGSHVLTTDPQAPDIARNHIAWLRDLPGEAPPATDDGSGRSSLD